VNLHQPGILKDIQVKKDKKVYGLRFMVSC
jgi:hypothetical protein